MLRKKFSPTRKRRLAKKHLNFQTLETRRLMAVDLATVDAARDVILNDVNDITVVGSTGQVAVFDPVGAPAGQGAFAVTHDGDNDTEIAAAIWGTGRIVAYPHDGYVNLNDHAATHDTGQLYHNSIQWATNSADNAASLTQRIVTNSSSAETWLTAQGYTNVTHRSDWENGLAEADLLITVLTGNVSTAQQTAVANFVQAGGGLMTGGTGWGIAQSRDLRTLPGNVLLAQAGLGWADGFTGGTTVHRSTEFGNASFSLEAVEQYWAETRTLTTCLLYTSPSPRDATLSRMPSSA